MRNVLLFNFTNGATPHQFNFSAIRGPRPHANFSSASFGSGAASQNGTGFQVSKSPSNSSSNSTAVFAVPPFNLKLSDVDYGPQINVVIWFLTALSGLFLALRIHCKFLRHRGLWWDDHVLIASWVALVLNCCFVTYTISLGFGRSVAEFNFSHLNDYLLNVNLAGTFSILAAVWSKTSFAITVLRISEGWTKRCVWFIIISVNIALGLSIAFTWGQCTPIIKIWKPFTPGTCWSKEYVIAYNIFTAAYSGAMDIVLAIIPWKIIWSLTMNKKEKAGVLFAMSMGVFAGVTSIVKVRTLPAIANSDITRATTDLVLLAVAEVAVSIMAASIPILRALLRDTSRLAPPVPAFGNGGYYSSSAYYTNYDGENEVFTGAPNARGSGRTSTVVSSTRASRLSKEFAPTAAKPVGAGRPPPFTIVQTEEVSVEYEYQDGYNTRRDTLHEGDIEKNMDDKYPEFGRAI